MAVSKIRRMTAAIFCMCIALAIAIVVQLYAPSAGAKNGSNARVNEAESIKGFSSELRILEDSSVLITENLPLHIEADPPRHGIFRILPVRMPDTDNADEAYEVGYEIISIFRDNQPEGFDLIPADGDLALRIGSNEVQLPAGDLSYFLTYKAKNAITFHADREEFVWYVVGGWGITVPGASIDIHLPKLLEAKSLSVTLWLEGPGVDGQMGLVQLKPNEYTIGKVTEAQDRKETSNQEESIRITIKTVLSEKQMLKMRLVWPKGFLKKLN